MPPFQKHQRLFRDAKTAQGTFPARTLLEDIARAYALGREHPIVDPTLGRGSRTRGVDPDRVHDLTGLSRDCAGSRNLVWAAFYCGLIHQQPPFFPATWHCIVQQQLTKALVRLPKSDIERILDAHQPFGLSRPEWKMNLSGAFAVARAGAALNEIGGRVYLPHLSEDVRGKIDLIYQFPTLERGLCLQLKSDAGADETTHQVVDEAAASADPEGYFERFLAGVRILGRYNPGIAWIPVLLTVGQRPYLDQAVVSGCPPIFRGVHAMHTELRGPPSEALPPESAAPPSETQEPTP